MATMLIPGHDREDLRPARRYPIAAKGTTIGRVRDMRPLRGDRTRTAAAKQRTLERAAARAAKAALR